MKKALIAFGMLLMTAGAVNAGGLVTKHASSVQLTVDAARSTASRVGSSFSISGSNIDTTDGSTAGTVSAGTITSGVYNPGTIAATQDTAGCSRERAARGAAGARRGHRERLAESGHTAHTATGASAGGGINQARRRARDSQQATTNRGSCAPYCINIYRPINIFR